MMLSILLLYDNHDFYIRATRYLAEDKRQTYAADQLFLSNDSFDSSIYFIDRLFQSDTPFVKLELCRRRISPTGYWLAEQVMEVEIITRGTRIENPFSCWLPWVPMKTTSDVKRLCRAFRRMRETAEQKKVQLLAASKAA